VWPQTQVHSSSSGGTEETATAVDNIIGGNAPTATAESADLTLPADASFLALLGGADEADTDAARADDLRTEAADGVRAEEDDDDGWRSSVG
jgi:hypothetical protein